MTLPPAPLRNFSKTLVAPPFPKFGEYRNMSLKKNYENKGGEKRRTMLTTNKKERRKIWLRPDWAQIDLSIFANFSIIFQNEKNRNVRKNSYKGVKLLECHQKNLLPF